MDTDEREISTYLKACAGQWVSGREISRRASGKRRYRDDPSWAAQPLIRLMERSIIESDSTGHYRLKAYEQRIAELEQERKMLWDKICLLGIGAPAFAPIPQEAPVEKNDSQSQPKKPPAAGALSCRIEALTTSSAFCPRPLARGGRLRHQSWHPADA